MFTHNNYQAEDPQQNMQMQTQASRKQYSMIMIAIVSVVVFTLFALVVHRQQIAGASRLQYDTAVEHNFVSKRVFTGKEWPPLEDSNTTNSVGQEMLLLEISFGLEQALAITKRAPFVFKMHLLEMCHG